MEYFDQVCASDVPISKMLVDGDYWVCWDLIWVIWGPLRSHKKGHFGPKWSLLAKTGHLFLILTVFSSWVGDSAG